MHRHNKPISEFTYRIIAICLLLPPIAYSFLAAINNLAPYSYIYEMLNYDEDRGLLAWSLTLFVIIAFPLLILLVLRAFADIPAHPFTKLPLRQLIFGEDDGYITKEDIQVYEGRHQIASWSERLLAGLLDYLCAGILVISGLMVMKVRLLFPDMGYRDRHLVFMILLGSGIGYLLLRDIFNGQSIAKRLFQIKVIRDDVTDETSPKLRLITRQLPSILCSILLFVDIVLIVSKVKRQKIGDLMSGTMVIKHIKNKDLGSDSFL